MRSIGIDLHKRSLTVCVIDQTTGETFTRTFSCQDESRIAAFFAEQGRFQAVVEASASYEWLWQLLEPMADRLILAHPKKLRIIAESKRKTDRFDSRALAWMLSKDEIPEAHRPTPLQRQYRVLVQLRLSLVRQRTALKNQIRSVLANRNLDRPGIFKEGRKWFVALKLSPAEKFSVLSKLDLIQALEQQIEAAEAELKKFRGESPEAQRKDHYIAKSVPGVGDHTADIIIATLGDVRRFSSIRKVASYAGLAPGFRQSDKKRRDLHITKEGPAILRWALVEAAWRAVRFDASWRRAFEALSQRTQRKKAIVAIARRLLGVIYALLKKGEVYSVQGVKPKVA